MCAPVGACDRRCKHASVMQKLCAELMNAGRECRPEQYLFLFLKFISAVCPTIEYDYTLSVDGL
jgi:ubiquitin-like-conjugating enzyme ATG3